MQGQNRPSESSFYNQRLKAWHPILTAKWVIISFLVVGVVFIPLGAVLLAASNSVVEMAIKYDGEGAELNDCGADPLGETVCTHKFTLSQDMKAPVYVYYQLENFFQNHRRYVKSRSDDQLRGEVFPESDLQSCDPRVMSLTAPDKVLHPCGLIANSFFNDTFELSHVAGNSSNVMMYENDISWKSDRDYKFKAVPDDVRAQYPDHQFINDTYPGIVDSVANEHFIVWMRTAALPTFRKLYGRIEQDLSEGDELTFTINSRFPVASFEGSKTLVLSTVSFLGGKNPFLGIAYIVVGCLCLVFGLGFAIKQWKCRREPGDVRSLNWQR